MSIIKCYILLWLLLIGFIAHAQENSSNLGIELGAIGYYNSVKEKDFIRKLSSKRIDDKPSDDLSGLLITSYFGLNYERTFFKDRLGITTGVRFTKVNSSVGLKLFSSRNDQYFYLRAREDGTTTEFIRATRIRQDSRYVGIPLEMRYMFFHSHFARLYIKAGTVFDFLTKSNNRIDLAKNYVAARLTKEAERDSGTPSDFSASLYGGIGVRLGETFPMINIELTLPSILLTPNYSSLVKPVAGTGIHFMLQIPLKAKK